jgi:putative endonuclease
MSGDKFFSFLAYRTVILLAPFLPSLISRKCLKPSLVGKYGEYLAAQLIKSKKYKIIHQNWTGSLDRRREIDLIGMDDEILVFIEVRSRSAKSTQSGYESISKRKKTALEKACRDYLRINPNTHYRFDVIEIDLNYSINQADLIFHHKNVSLFS